MHKPQSPTERKLIEVYLEVEVYGKVFPTYTNGYNAAIERDGSREWDEQGRLRAILDISPVKQEGVFPDLLDGGTSPIWLSIEINEEQFIGGVRVTWDMPANEWGDAQANWWPSKPVLHKPGDSGKFNPDNLETRFEMRMKQGLKQWTIQQGGAAYVRSLLETAREKVQ